MSKYPPFCYITSGFIMMIYSLSIFFGGIISDQNDAGAQIAYGAIFLILSLSAIWTGVKDMKKNNEI